MLSTSSSQPLNPYRAHLAIREIAFQKALDNGDIDPFLYPWDALPALILNLAVLFIPGRRRSRLYAYLAFALIVALCVSTTTRCRSLGMTGGYGIGMMCAWGVLWSAVVLLCNDPRKDFRRLERREVKMTKSTIGDAPGTDNANGVANASAKDIPLTSRTLRNRSLWGISGTSSEPASDDEDAKTSTAYKLVWQGYPKSMRHRLDWTIDLCTSFRGPGWNWRISTLPPVDLPASLSPSKSADQAHLATTTSTTLRMLNRKTAADFILHYLLVDIIKTTMTPDPYFWGDLPLSSPLPYNNNLFHSLSTHPIGPTTVRLLLSLSAIISTLNLTFSLSPLIYSLILPALSPPHMTRSPLTEPLLYPPYWGPFVESVLDHGLPGWWGKWWHQMCRFGCQEPSRVLLRKLGWEDPQTAKAKILRVMAAFAISGSLHACASYSAFAATSRPISGPFTFFLLQGVGVLGQSAFAKWFAKNIFDVKRRGTPWWVRRVLNLVSVAVWFYWTGPLLADDFARCGVWLSEPLPVSFVRGLGLGPEGERGRWWCWSGRLAGWWG